MIYQAEVFFAQAGVQMSSIYSMMWALLCFVESGRLSMQQKKRASHNCRPPQAMGNKFNGARSLFLLAKELWARTGRDGKENVLRWKTFFDFSTNRNNVAERVFFSTEYVNETNWVKGRNIYTNSS